MAHVEAGHWTFCLILCLLLLPLNSSVHFLHICSVFVWYLEEMRSSREMPQLYIDDGQWGCPRDFVTSHHYFLSGLLWWHLHSSQNVVSCKQSNELFSLYKPLSPVLLLLNTRNHSGTSTRLWCDWITINKNLKMNKGMLHFNITSQISFLCS